MYVVPPLIHTIVVMKASESYNILAESFENVFDEINQVVANPVIDIEGQQYKIILYNCYDYKGSLACCMQISGYI